MTRQLAPPRPQHPAVRLLVDVGVDHLRPGVEGDAHQHRSLHDERPLLGPLLAPPGQPGQAGDARVAGRQRAHDRLPLDPADERPVPSGGLAGPASVATFTSAAKAAASVTARSAEDLAVHLDLGGLQPGDEA